MPQWLGLLMSWRTGEQEAREGKKDRVLNTDATLVFNRVYKESNNPPGRVDLSNSS